MASSWRDGDFLDKLKCKILVVGAGGIGCELLKNLALTGFSDIEVIDLDTIDVSNLNRQFLFHKQHVGKSKAEVAAGSVKRLAPGMNIKFYHDSIMRDCYDVPFFQQFTVVLNALDNRAARNHVNRLCLAAGIPLVESGSAGYLGQVAVIKKGETECYECTPKPAQRTYPGCTIRNTPSEPIHCIVWAKHLFNQLFGEVDIDDDVSPDVNDPENAKIPNGDAISSSSSSALNGTVNMEMTNGDSGDGKTEQNGSAKTAFSTRRWAELHGYKAQKLYDKLFHDDIQYLLSMENLWKKRAAPTPLLWSEAGFESAGSSRRVSLGENDEIWDGETCRKVFEDCVKALKQCLDDRQYQTGDVLVWDKDDKHCVRFVAACANIRAHIFSIPQKSLFDIKAMAGNIIPAIATTNAMVAGMIVIEALKIIDGQFDRCRSVFIRRQPTPRGKILVDAIPERPNPKCYVCSSRRELRVGLNLAEFTVRMLEERLLKGHLNMIAPDVTNDANGSVILSSEPGETEALLGKSLAELHVNSGAYLQCDDFRQQFELRLVLLQNDQLKGEDFVIVSDEGNTKESTDEDKNEIPSALGQKRAADEDVDLVAEGAKRARID